MRKINLRPFVVYTFHSVLNCLNEINFNVLLIRV